MKSRVLIATMTLTLVTALSTGSTFAQSPTGKPGWGFGDHNHIHLGPPGQSVNPSELQKQIRAENERMRKEIEAYVARIRLLVHNWTLNFNHS